MTLDPKRKPVRVEYWRPDGTLDSVVETDGRQASRLKARYRDEFRVEIRPANSRAVCTCGKIFDWTADGYVALSEHVNLARLDDDCVRGSAIPADLRRLRLWLDAETVT